MPSKQILEAIKKDDLTTCCKLIKRFTYKINVLAAKFGGVKFFNFLYTWKQFHYFELAQFFRMALEHNNRKIARYIHGLRKLNVIPENYDQGYLIKLARKGCQNSLLFLNEVGITMKPINAHRSAFSQQLRGHFEYPLKPSSIQYLLVLEQYFFFLPSFTRKLRYRAAHKFVCVQAHNELLGLLSLIRQGLLITDIGRTIATFLSTQVVVLFKSKAIQLLVYG